MRNLPCFTSRRLHAANEGKYLLLQTTRGMHFAFARARERATTVPSDIPLFIPQTRAPSSGRSVDVEKINSLPLLGDA